LFATRTTNRHIKQNDAILFADHPIGLANGYLFTVSAKEFHGCLSSKANADYQFPLK
jgi:hypothetical protein